MLSIQILLGKDDEFYDLLESSVQEAQQSAQALHRLLHQPQNRPALEEFVNSRRKDKLITKEIGERLVKTFVTHLERDEIEVLASALYKIPKTIQKFAERYLLAQHLVADADFGRPAAMIEEACGLVMEMLRALRRQAHLEEVKTLNDQLQQIESEADQYISETTRDLYTRQKDPLRAMALKDLYELLERVIDRCRDAGNAMNYVVLKHS